MRHDPHGFWISELPALQARPPLRGNESADVAIVGGGFTGMWAAWWLKRWAPESDVVLIEADACGRGPSGRNGGFCNSLWFSLPTLVERFGDSAALEVCRAAGASVSQIGEWCREQDVDARFDHGGYLQTSTCEAQDGAWEPVHREMRRLGVGELALALDRPQIAARCASPRFRRAALYPEAATVDPARLADGLRTRLLDAGVRIFEHTAMRRLRRGAGGAEVEVEGGTLRAPHVLLGNGTALLRVGGLRRALTATSSHMVITEPVPDVLEELGWTGGECITDSRAMIHYFRTTIDGRIAFGWGGGKILYGSRAGARVEVDPRMVRRVEAHMRSFFPQLEGRRVVHAWGGPIDISPSHLPVIRSLGDSVHAGFGYTGNGVAPSQLIGRMLAALALDRGEGLEAPALIDPPGSSVPPEPFRFLGGSVIRSSILRKERLQEEGRRPGPLTRAVSGIPERLGIHLGR
jgi:glycine/D-amino acid oxidase-like deaminating enzyme